MEIMQVLFFHVYSYYMITFFLQIYCLNIGICSPTVLETRVQTIVNLLLKKQTTNKHVVECEAVLEDYCNCSQINFHVDYNRLLTEKRQNALI